MQFTTACANLIEPFESFKANPYKDFRGIPTIGYGTIEYKNGTKVTMFDSPINKEQAEDLLVYHLNKEELPIFQTSIKVDQNQYQIDALGCLAYNIGINGFKNSSLLKAINLSEATEIIKPLWLEWDTVNHKPIEGLLERRQLEWEYYNK